MKKVLVVILNFHQAEFVLNLVNDINNQNNIEPYIIVGDIQPKDEQLFNNINDLNMKNLLYINIEDNPGYAVGNNRLTKIGLEKFNADYVLISNPDIKIDEPNVIFTLVDKMSKNPITAVIGPKVLLESNRQQGPYRRPHPLKFSLKYLMPFAFLPIHLIENIYIHKINKDKKIWRIIGAFMLIDRQIFEKLNYFDSRTFLYCEEDLLSNKVYRSNYQVVYTPDVYVRHLHHYTRNVNPNIEKKYVESMRLMFKELGHSNFLISLCVFSRKVYMKLWSKLF